MNSFHVRKKLIKRFGRNPYKSQYRETNGDLFSLEWLFGEDQVIFRFCGSSGYVEVWTKFGEPNNQHRLGGPSILSYRGDGTLRSVGWAIEGQRMSFGEYLNQVEDVNLRKKFIRDYL